MNLNWFIPTPWFNAFAPAVTLNLISLPSVTPFVLRVSAANVGTALNSLAPDTADDPVALIVEPELAPVPCVPVLSDPLKSTATISP